MILDLFISESGLILIYVTYTFNTYNDSHVIWNVFKDKRQRESSHSTWTRDLPKHILIQSTLSCIICIVNAHAAALLVSIVINIVFIIIVFVAFVILLQVARYSALIH